MHTLTLTYIWTDDYENGVSLKLKEVEFLVYLTLCRDVYIIYETYIYNMRDFLHEKYSTCVTFIVTDDITSRDICRSRVVERFSKDKSTIYK